MGTTGCIPKDAPSVPAWARLISSHHGTGLLSVAAYEHSRVGAVTRAFCRRMKRIERRARAQGLPAVQRLAKRLRHTMRRFGHRGATDNILAGYRVRWSTLRARVLVESDAGRRAQRRARYLFDRIALAFVDLQAARVGR
jgi:hypothetical protein